MGKRRHFKLIHSVIDDVAENTPKCFKSYDCLNHTAFAVSRSLNFWILPVDVFGTVSNTM